MIAQAEDLVAEYLASARLPAGRRDPMPFLAKLAAAIQPFDPRELCRHVAAALARRGLPAPAVDSLDRNLGQPGPDPAPAPELPPEPPPAENPTFAFVMANRNDSRWLRRSVPALCEQSRRADQVVIVDDGSTDDSREVLAAFQQKYPALSVHLNDRNTGPCAAIRSIWPHIRADYVAFAAADDLVAHDFLAVVEPLVRQHPGIGAVHGQTYVWFPDSDRSVMDLPTHLFRHILGRHSGAEYRRLLLGGPVTINGNVACFRRAVIDRLGMFDPRLEHVADTFLFQQVLLAAGICYVEKPLGIFTRHAAQHSTVQMRDAGRRIEVHGRLLDLWATEGFAGYRADVIRYPALLENYPMLVRDLVWRPDAWDILIAYASWSALRSAVAEAGSRLLRGS